MFGDDLDQKDGGPAFAAGAANNETGWTQEGMSLRDWFAGQAIASEAFARAHHRTPGMMAKHAYELADAMLVARRNI